MERWIPWLVGFLIVVLVVAPLIYSLVASGQCPEGYFYSWREYACLPGVRP